MKKTLILGLFTSILLLFSFPVYGKELLVEYGDKKIYLNSIEKDDNIFLPFRDIFTLFDYDIVWKEDRQIIQANKGNDFVHVIIGENELIKNGSRMFFKNPVFLDGNSSYIDIAFLSQIMFKEISIKDNTLLISDKKNLNQDWRKSFERVAQYYANKTLNIDCNIVHSAVIDELANVSFETDDFKHIALVLYRPQGKDGIWEVAKWYDVDYTSFITRDMSNLSPIFMYEDIPENYKNPLKNHITKKVEEVYSDYYIEAMEEKVNSYIIENDNISFDLNLDIYYRNFYKDPDTIESISSLKKINPNKYLEEFNNYNILKNSRKHLIIKGKIKDNKLIENSLNTFIVENEEGIIDYIPFK